MSAFFIWFFFYLEIFKLFSLNHITTNNYIGLCVSVFVCLYLVVYEYITFKYNFNRDYGLLCNYNYYIYAYYRFFLQYSFHFILIFLCYFIMNILESLYNMLYFRRLLYYFNQFITLIVLYLIIISL